jgi:hypothetical protein
LSSNYAAVIPRHSRPKVAIFAAYLSNDRRKVEDALFPPEPLPPK